MNARKRLYAIIMILAAIALGVDKLVLSDGVTTPDVAAANVGPVTAALTETPSPAPVDMAFIPELPFPYEVSRFTFGDDVPDLFAPPGAGGVGPGSPEGSDNAHGAGGSPIRSGDMDRETFEQRHGLTGTLAQPRLKIAIVDGVWLRIGESLDGCKLIDVAGDLARFECYDGQAAIAFTHETKPRED